MLPDQMPRNNLWYISLCNERSCRHPDDPTVVAHFPIAGFAMGERSPEDMSGLASAGWTATALLSIITLVMRQ